MRRESSEWTLANFRAAREELLFRIEHRDQWFKLHLLVLVGIWALANGIEYQAKPLGAIPSLVLLSPPIAMAWAALYYVEDIIIHQLSRYVATLSADVRASGNASRDESPEPVRAWDESPELESYAKDRGLRLRVLGQAVAFVILPAYVSADYLWATSTVPWLLLDCISLVGTSYLIAAGFRKRSGTGGAAKPTLPQVMTAG